MHISQNTFSLMRKLFKLRSFLFSKYSDKKFKLFLGSLGKATSNNRCFFFHCRSRDAIISYANLNAMVFE